MWLTPFFFLCSDVNFNRSPCYVRIVFPRFHLEEQRESSQYLDIAGNNGKIGIPLSLRLSHIYRAKIWTKSIYHMRNISVKTDSAETNNIGRSIGDVQFEIRRIILGENYVVHTTSSASSDRMMLEIDAVRIHMLLHLLLRTPDPVTTPDSSKLDRKNDSTSSPLVVSKNRGTDSERFLFRCTALRGASGQLREVEIL